jgi:hypothetical protein
MFLCFDFRHPFKTIIVLDNISELIIFRYEDPVHHLRRHRLRRFVDLGLRRIARIACGAECRKVEHDREGVERRPDGE